MRYGIEIIKGANQNEYFGYKEDIETGKRIYICHAYSAECCNKMLDKIAKEFLKYTEV